MTSVSDSFGSLTFVHDNLDRVTSETQSIAGLTPSVKLDSTYDLNSNRVSLGATIGTTADFKNSYFYDQLNRVISQKQFDQGGNVVADKLVKIGYNKLGQFTSLTRFESLLPRSEGSLRTFFEYDDANRLDKVAHWSFLPDRTGTLEDRMIFGYDELDRIKTIDWLLDGSSVFDYDKIGQVLDATHSSQANEDYDYDLNGNRIGGDYVNEGNNETTEDSDFSYEYDGEGNRTRRTSKADNSFEMFDFDQRNRLVAVTFFSAAGVEQKSVEYQYDPFNRLTRRTVDADGPGGDAPTDQFFAGYDGISPTLEFDGTEATDVSHRYMWGPQVDMLLSDEQVDTTTSAGNTLWALTDHLGTIRNIADYDHATSSFDVTNHLVYDSFGNLNSQTDASVQIAFGFTGKFVDDQTEFTLHWNRWLDPKLGKWISQDPIGFAAGDANLSRYVGNNSMSFVDPLGLDESNIQLSDEDQSAFETGGDSIDPFGPDPMTSNESAATIFGLDENADDINQGMAELIGNDNNDESEKTNSGVVAVDEYSGSFFSKQQEEAVDEFIEDYGPVVGGVAVGAASIAASNTPLDWPQDLYEIGAGLLTGDWVRAGFGAWGMLPGGLGAGGEAGQAAGRASRMAPKGPTIGGGATLDKLTPNEITRIQNAANRTGKDISAVGSRVNPNKPLHANSDFDFAIDANNKTRRSAGKSLPGAKNIQEGIPGNQDIFKGTVDPNLPHVTFHPER